MAEKQALRAEVYEAIRVAKVGRFPGILGRIPNFKGAEAAAERLAGLEVWRSARVLKINPDSPQRALRARALREGKTLVMPAPKLAAELPFLLLEPDRIPPEKIWEASSIKGSAGLGRYVGAAEVPALDLIVTGCVAAGRDGARLGKGGGYSDLEYALLRELGLVSADTPIATTVHGVQLQEVGAVPMAGHDISLDLVVTPDEVVWTGRTWPRPEGVAWELLSDEKVASMPVLRRLRSP